MDYGKSFKISDLRTRTVQPTMSAENRQYKVSRIAEKYGLTNLEDELVKLWTQEDDRVSLRDLATYFNEWVLQTAVETAGMNALEGEVENMYRLLTDDDVSRGVKTETRKKLERHGIDVEELESDFVTYQAVRTYLKEGRDVEYERGTDAERTENVGQSISRLQNRTIAVTEEKLAQLEQTDRMELGEFRVLLDLRVFCEDCGSRYKVGELLQQGGCQCRSTSAKEE